MKKTFLLIILHITIFASGQTVVEKSKHDQQSIIDQYYLNCAKKRNYNFQMKQWQECLDQGLKKDSTIAYLWQQKAMPYFKARKYEIGMQYIDKAVKYNAKEWQPYRAFIKCIFAKTYKEAILDFEDCIQKYGNNYVMDHTYNFYIAISYLQLNEYKKAEDLLEEYNNEFTKRTGTAHYTALFYNGIAKYELQKWEEAIIEFDKALKIYATFSDAKYYKGICLARLDNKEAFLKLLKESEDDYKKGYKLNEDNTIYETYPYQKKWDF